jgi:methionyl-tRNA synthetase
MSKSKGNVINPETLITKYGAEVLKYFLTSQIKIGEDGIFDEDLLIKVYNADLANNFGNLVSRTLTMINSNFDDPIKFNNNLLKEDQDVLDEIINSLKNFTTFADDFQIDKALEVAKNLSKTLNGYIDLTAP